MIEQKFATEMKFIIRNWIEIFIQKNRLEAFMGLQLLAASIHILMFILSFLFQLYIYPSD